MAKSYYKYVLSSLALAATVAVTGTATAQTRTLNMQATWPASLTLSEHFTYWAERVDKLSDAVNALIKSRTGKAVPAARAAAKPRKARKAPRSRKA